MGGKGRRRRGGVTAAIGAHDKGPGAQDPRDGKLSRRVLKWRAEGRPSSRPYLGGSELN